MIAKKIAKRLSQLQADPNDLQPELQKVKDAAMRTRVGWGISVTNPRASMGINIEKWPDHNEYYFKVYTWPDNEGNTFETEGELDDWLNNYWTADLSHIETYRVVNEDGIPIATRGYDPDLDDQQIGEYEQHGPDPIRFQDLQ